MFNKTIENGDVECIKETTSQLKSRKHPKATNWSSTKKDNPKPGGVLTDSPSTGRVLVQ